jgi:TatD DNase family protein
MSNLSLVDTHAHLDLSNFDSDRTQVIARAQAAGVHAIVAVGIDAPSSRAALALARSNAGIYPAVGLHPQESKDVTSQDSTALAKLAETTGVVAIGEIGLDYYHDYSPHEKQLAVFRYQLELAATLKLPVLLHCRAAESDFIPTLDIWLANHHLPRPGIIHCFSGSLEAAQHYLEQGFCLGLGGYITYPSSKGLRQTLKQLPLERLLLETDCPFLPPQSHRGQRNEPAYIVETAEELARIKGVRVEEVVRLTSENARGLFRFS